MHNQQHASKHWYCNVMMIQETKSAPFALWLGHSRFARLGGWFPDDILKIAAEVLVELHERRTSFYTSSLKEARDRFQESFLASWLQLATTITALNVNRCKLDRSISKQLTLRYSAASPAALWISTIKNVGAISNTFNQKINNKLWLVVSRLRYGSSWKMYSRIGAESLLPE